MVQQKKIRSCQRTNRLPISVQATQHSFTWARVMSKGITLHKMAEHNNNWYRERWNSWVWNDTGSSETVQRGVKWVSPRWNGTVFSQVTYSTTSNGTAFREIAWHTFRRCSLRSRTQLGVKWYSVTSNGTALREMVQHTSRLFRAIISERNIFRTSSTMQCMKHSIWNNRVLHEGTKCSNVKLGLGGVTSVRRNHQKYKTRMEQPRVNWDRGQYDVTLVTFWRQTSRNSDSISVTPASCIVVLNSPSLFRFTKLCMQFAAISEDISDVTNTVTQ